MARFSCKAVLSGHTKRDGTQGVYLRAIIDRKPAVVPLGFYINPKHFDPRTGRIRSAETNSELFNIEIGIAIGRANKIASDYRREERYLIPSEFKKEFLNPINKQNFVDFFTTELELRKPKIELITYRQHKTVLTDLKSFKPSILFAEFSVELIQRFENHLITKRKNKPNTVRKKLKIMKSYLSEAERKNVKFKNPFDNYKLHEAESQKPTLSFKEVQHLFEYYYKSDTERKHKKVLRYFLFSCLTGLRISDVMRITWNNIHDNTLIFVPYKTRKADRWISIPLTSVHVSLLPDTSDFSGPIFDCYAEQVTNRHLKEIAKVCKLKKHITYHIARHTFATEFLSRGGQLDTLQQILGHRMITTTMKYVRVKDERKRTELSAAFDSINPVKVAVSN